MTDAEFRALCERLVLLPVATAEDVHDLRLLVDEARRGRKLERAVGTLVELDQQGKAHVPGVYTTEKQRKALDAIGRLLEGEG